MYNVNKEEIYKYAENRFQICQIIKMSMLAVAVLTKEWRTERRVLPSDRPGKPTGRQTAAL